MGLHPIIVSIPFKRESGSKPLRQLQIEKRWTEFQFPSNGKAVPNDTHGGWETHAGNVSIPFKRESGSKRVVEAVLSVNLLEFQFPSNGKAVPNASELVRSVFLSASVSIPFKRESGSKHKYIGGLWIYKDKRFNSLQTGKRFQTKSTMVLVQIVVETVSIPFKRESGSKL